MHAGDRGLLWAGWSVLIGSAAIVVAVPLLMLMSRAGRQWLRVDA